MKRFIPKGLASWLNRLIIAILVIAPILFFILHICDSTFVDSAMGNWFATMIGALAGVGVAVELYRWQERREHKARRSEERERTIKIMRLVGEELKYNKDKLLASKAETGSQTKRMVLVDGLRDELWSALSDGGELRWIRNLQLMYAISSAYHYIRRTIFLEKRYLEIRYSPASPVVDTSTPRADLEMLLLEVDTSTLKYIESALDEIGKSILALERIGQG